jgi:phosphate transport system protein
MMGQERQNGGLDWDNGRSTMSRCFVRDMEGLWSELLKFAAVVEETLDRCVQALRDGRVDQAQEVKRQKRLVDRWEVQIEQECVRVLALHQPVASDLRRVAAVLKINGDLHRLCDLARHIAKRVKKLAADPQATPIPQALEDLGLEALDQVHESLDALTRSNVTLARSVIDADQRIDRDYRAVQKQLKQEIVVSPQRINTLLRLVNTARNLERIADHAVKIAESVIYLEHGDILRHRPAGGEAAAPSAR